MEKSFIIEMHWKGFYYKGAFKMILLKELFEKDFTSWIHSAQSARAVEYTNCISTLTPKECPAYDIKQSEGEAPVLEL